MELCRTLLFLGELFELSVALLSSARTTVASLVLLLLLTDVGIDRAVGKAFNRLDVGVSRYVLPGVSVSDDIDVIDDVLEW